MLPDARLCRQSEEAGGILLFQKDLRQGGDSVMFSHDIDESDITAPARSPDVAYQSVWQSTVYNILR